MASFLYTLVIFPVVQILELSYLIMFRVFNNPAIALFGVSAAVSVLTLPLYFLAEKYQQKERDLQNRLKPKINKIKAVFRGDEQYMILSTYYKQNHYHPIYALRNTFSLLIQIPFFIAAYLYLSHLEILRGASFLFIKDLGAPDGILSFGSIHVNFLPLFMTFINIISGAIYSKGLAAKDRIQLYGMSLVFLVLLYNSPAGLVLYWTMNNIFSLAKNIIQKTGNAKRIVFAMLLPVVLALDIFLLFVHPGDLPNRLVTALLVTSLLSLPFIADIAKKITDSRLSEYRFPVYFYIISCFILFLLHGGIVPSSLIASSVGEFSFVGSRTTPFPFILETLRQGAGIFLFWPIAVYFLAPVKARHILTVIMFIIMGIAMADIFLVTENFGFLTPTMIFSEPKPFALIPGTYTLNALILCAVIALLFFLAYRNKAKVIVSLQVITLTALLGYGVVNAKKIYDNFIFVKEQYTAQGEHAVTPQYVFSKTGNNVLLVMLDCAVGGYVPYIFEEKPELNSVYTGFRWYPNCVSFASHTLIGALPLYGGYEYTPVAVNARDKTTLLDKQREAYLLLPKIFSGIGYQATVTDPPFDNHSMSNLAVFAEQPEIRAENLIGKYTMQWLREHPEITAINITELLDSNLIRFSFFKSAPLFLRLFIYDDGKWLRLADDSKNQLTDTVIDDYVFLDTLNKITGVSGEGNTYTALYAHLPHGEAFLQYPDYLPVQQVTDKGSGLLAGDTRFHLMMASFIMLGKWFEYLKTAGVYDNTRIILVADHGRGSADFPGNFSLPDGRSLQTFNPLLLVKDFYAEGEPDRSDVFMTNGDVPLLALNGIVDNPVNPFTHVPLKADKDNGATIATIGAVSTYRHGKYTYNIGKNQWLHVKDNIFDPANWEVVSQ